MTPAAIYRAVRDFLVIAAVGFVAWRVYDDGKNSVRADQLQDLQRQVSEQAKTQKQWHTEATDANKTLTDSIQRINVAPVVVHDWMRPQPACQKQPMLPAAASATVSGPASGGGVQSVDGATPTGPQRDRIVADYKRFWEARLAGCRVLYDSWPQP